MYKSNYFFDAQPIKSVVKLWNTLHWVHNPVYLWVISTSLGLKSTNSKRALVPGSWVQLLNGPVKLALLVVSYFVAWAWKLHPPTTQKCTSFSNAVNHRTFVPFMEEKFNQAGFFEEQHYFLVFLILMFL